MRIDEGDFIKRAKKHLRFETDIEKPELQIIQKESSIYGEDIVLSVESEVNNDSWWLIGGSTPITLIRQDRLNADKAYEFHIGVTGRQIRQQSSSDPQHIEDSEFYHVFISHASEDKAEFAAPLENELSDMGLSVWYDDTEILPGDSIYRSIEAGLNQCSFGIAVYSEAYFEKEWTQDELSGLIGRQTAEGRVMVLPALFEMSISDLRNQAPMLADTYAIDASGRTVSEVAEELFQTIVKHSVDEAKSQLSIDTSIERSNTGEAASKSTPNIASDVMIAHEIHYFDGRHFAEDDISTHRASQIIDDIKQAEDVVRITTEDDGLEGLSDDDLVLFTGPVIATPLNKFYNLVNKYDMIGSEINIESEEDKLILEQIRDAANYYKTTIPKREDGYFIFELQGSHLKNNVDDFTDDYREHSIIGKVKHIYEKDQRDHFIEMLDDAPIRNRREKTERRRQLKGLASAMSDFGDDVTDSDFYIAYPDITVTPVAVYD